MSTAPAESSTTNESKIVVPHPREVQRHLNHYVLGQHAAKATLAVAVHNHYKALTSDRETPEGTIIDEFSKFNVLIIGPTGSGKTFLLDTMSRTLQVPFVKIDTTKITQSGYVGDKLENALVRLYTKSGFKLDVARRGIIYFDEFDKIAKAETAGGLDVAGEGVQKGLLSLLGGAKISISTKGLAVPQGTPETIEFDTANVMFVCGGAFVGLERIIERRRKGERSMGFRAPLGEREADQKRAYEMLLKVTDKDLIDFGMIPELVGRLPIRTAVMPLSIPELRRILTEPRNSLVDQFKALLKGEVDLEFSEEALTAIATEAWNGDTGARALAQILAETMLPTNLLLPAKKRIEKDDVEKREDKLAEALRMADDAAEQPQHASTSVVTTAFFPMVGESITEVAKPLAVRQLDLPLGAWEVWKRGSGDKYFLRLMSAGKGRLFYHIKMAINGPCTCKHSTEFQCEWLAPYKKSVNPFAMMGTVKVGWVCEKCKHENSGTLDLTQSDPKNYGWTPDD